MENKVEQNSKILINNFNLTNIFGVTKVLSATPSSVSFFVGSKQVVVTGSNLHVLKLDVDSKILDLEGEVDSIKFGKQNKSKNFFKKIFS